MKERMSHTMQDEISNKFHKLKFNTTHKRTKHKPKQIRCKSRDLIELSPPLASRHQKGAKLAPQSSVVLL